MIYTNDLSFIYPGSNPLKFPDISLEKKEELLILGPSGIGKTTLLHLLAGLLIPTTGDVVIDNKKLNKLRASELDHFRGQNIGLIFQKPHFIKSLSVLESLLLVQHLAGQKQEKTRAKELLERLDLSEKVNEKTYQLSEGQKQRLTICCALVNKPKVILADEPTSSLDDANCHRVVNLLKEQTAIEKSKLIIITHDQRLKTEFSNQISL